MTRKHYLQLPLLAMTAWLGATAALTAACGSRQQPDAATASQAISLHRNLPGDSSIYGLACDGCTDSLLVFLPYTGGDPDTFDILEARQNGRILGRPRIGDPLAVMLNPANRDEALCVINVGALDGEWCYMVTPRLRSADSTMPPLPDSIRRRILAPVEYTLKLKTDNTASMKGYMNRSGRMQSPAVYPDVTHYTGWHLYNGRLILRADTIAGFTREGDRPQTDTADIVLLMRDSLVLRIDDRVQPFYRKTVRRVDG